MKNTLRFLGLLGLFVGCALPLRAANTPVHVDTNFIDPVITADNPTVAQLNELAKSRGIKMEITPERASQISQFVLSFLPENLTEEQIQSLIPKLDDHFFELSGNLAR